MLMNVQETIQVLRLPHAADLPLPTYQTEHAAGFDLVAALPAGVVVRIKPGRRVAIPTGLAFALPAGVEGQIRSRSGLALHYGIVVLNAPSTVDADYRGEVHVILANFGDDAFEVKRGARIAQLVLSPLVRANLREVEKLDQTGRQIRGFGSTGKS
jgi:dUTP pyrophosphatase